MLNEALFANKGIMTESFVPPGLPYYDGVQAAITLYTLVMASLMITGGKLGALFGRRRMFVVGAVIYACGSLTTSTSAQAFSIAPRTRASFCSALSPA